MVSVVIADRRDDVREVAVRALIGVQGIEVIGEVRDPMAMPFLLARLRPDVILAGVRFIDVARLLSTTAGAITLVGLATELDDQLVGVLRAGLRSAVHVESDREQIIQCVRDAAVGRAVLVPPVTDLVLSRLRLRPPPTESDAGRLSQLSPREREILELLAIGRSDAQISADLFITRATVRSHLHHLMAKLAVADRAQAVALAYRHGLL